MHVTQNEEFKNCFLRSRVVPRNISSLCWLNTDVGTFFTQSNEPKSVLARGIGDCCDNLRNLQSVFLIVAGINRAGWRKIKVPSLKQLH